jgi:phenylalanyl-tRNA synthetase beta chain
MKVSLNTVKQYIDFELPPVDELVARINSQLGGVEEVIDLSAKYKGATIVKVVECEKHPNADKLNVCKVDAGTGELVQVVCGAPNVHAGMWAAWLPPESTVPATYDDKEPFVLGARELRGVMSNGMLASAKELAIGDSHEGILEINENEWRPYQAEIKPGAKFAEVFGLNDTIIDIENKMFTHRPDLFGQLGVAREIAGIQHKPFTSPDWYKNAPEFKSAEGLELQVENNAKDLVQRFMAVAIKDVVVKPSPLWLQCALVAMGGKPINNIVDATNYIMLLTAQPTHAYDYDKLRGHKLGTRMAKAGEELPLLNGKIYNLDESDIVIVDGEGTVGLAGIMGGGNSEVSPDTKNIVLEVANFDMYAVRKSSMRHGVFTDALTRFNKGQSPLQNPYVLNLLMKSVFDVADGTQASEVFGQDEPGVDRGPVQVTETFINERLGLSLSMQEITSLLANVEVGCSSPDNHDTHFEVFAPFWRTDIELPEDVVEEVGRLYGFDKLTRELPRRSTKPAPKNVLRELKQSIRDTLSHAGANEVLTYSFVHEKLLSNAGQNPEHAFKLSNALSPDLQYYRLSLMPSLLSHIHANIKAGHDEFSLYEIGKTHYKSEMDRDEPSIPNEDSHLAAVIARAGKNAPNTSAYYDAKKILEEVVDLQRVELKALHSFDLSTDEWGAQLTAAYEPNRSAIIVIDGQVWGVVGEFKSSVARAFKLPKFCAGFEIDLDIASKRQVSYRPLSRFPSITQDVSLKVPVATNYTDLYQSVISTASNTASDMQVEVSPISIYQADHDMSTKTITLRIKLKSYERTLTEKDASSITDAVAQAALKALQAVRI